MQNYSKWKLKIKFSFQSIQFVSSFIQIVTSNIQFVSLFIQKVSIIAYKSHNFGKKEPLKKKKRDLKNLKLSDAKKIYFVTMYLMAIIEKITSKIDANIRALYSASTIIPALYPTVAVATKRVSGIDRDSEISSNSFFFSSLIRVIEDSSLISII